MTNIHGVHRPANAAVAHEDREPHSQSQIWKSVKKQIKKLQEPHQKPDLKYDASSIKKDDASSIVSDDKTLIQGRSKCHPK